MLQIQGMPSSRRGGVKFRFRPGWPQEAGAACFPIPATTGGKHGHADGRSKKRVSLTAMPSLATHLWVFFAKPPCLASMERLIFPMRLSV